MRNRWVRRAIALIVTAALAALPVATAFADSDFWN
jgi:hypothetical protein